MTYTTDDRMAPQKTPWGLLLTPVYTHLDDGPAAQMDRARFTQ